MSGKIKVLYVDDNPLDRELVLDVLEQQHAEFELTTSADQHDFEKKLTGGDWDVILSDFNILGYDGLQVIQIVKEKFPETPVIIITGTGSEEMAAESIKTGASDYVIKSASHIRRLPDSIHKAIRLQKVETEQRQMEEALRKREAELLRAQQVAHFGNWACDPSTMQFSWSDEMFRIFGVQPHREVPLYHEILGMIHPDDCETFDTSVQQAIKEGIAYDLELRIVRPDGKIRWIHTISDILKDESGAITELIGITQDITERKQLENQLIQSHKLESIGLLAGGIAHDFNNILTSIIGFTEIALDEVEKGTTLEDSLQEVYTAGNRARDLVKQILTISRRDKKEVKPVQIVPPIKDALKMLRSTIPTSIEFKENITAEPCVVEVDSTQLQQVIVNLATNAMQAMGNDRGIMEVGVEPVDFDNAVKNRYPDIQPGKYVQITVSDTGVGISRENIERIFEPYFTTKEKGTGTGLGLSVINGIIKSAKGYISVYSELNKGTTFTVYLPLVNKEAVVTTEYAARHSHTGTETVLCVDDEPSILKMQQQLLENLGYKVLTISSSIEALEIFRSLPEKFDLVISDMTMPKMTGDELAKEIKMIRPDIPVILCTGFSQKISSALEDPDIDRLLMKPVGKTTMAETIRNVLGDARG